MAMRAEAKIQLVLEQAVQDDETDVLSEEQQAAVDKFDYMCRRQIIRSVPELQMAFITWQASGGLNAIGVPAISRYLLKADPSTRRSMLESLHLNGEDVNEIVGHAQDIAELASRIELSNRTINTY